MKSTLLLTALLLASVRAHADFPACAAEAAAKFSVPEKVFHAMALEAEANWDDKRNHHGPMGLYDLIIPIAAGGIGMPEGSVRTDPCVNYQAAAWWLMNEAGGRDGDIWEAVAVYYHGHKVRVSYPMRERVRSIYEQL